MLHFAIVSILMKISLDPDPDTGLRELSKRTHGRLNTTWQFPTAEKHGDARYNASLSGTVPSHCCGECEKSTHQEGWISSRVIVPGLLICSKSGWHNNECWIELCGPSEL